MLSSSSQRMLFANLLNALPFSFPAYSLLCSKGPRPLGLGQNKVELSSHTNLQGCVRRGRFLRWNVTQMFGLEWLSFSLLSFWFCFFCVCNNKNDDNKYNSNSNNIVVEIIILAALATIILIYYSYFFFFFHHHRPCCLSAPLFFPRTYYVFLGSFMHEYIIYGIFIEAKGKALVWNRLVYQPYTPVERCRR